MHPRSRRAFCTDASTSSSTCMLLSLSAAVLLLCTSAVIVAQQCQVQTKNDCGYVGIDEAQCQDKGCCWQPVQGSPYCYYPTTTVPVWNVSSITPSSTGFTSLITLTNPGAGSHGLALSELYLEAMYESEEYVHFRLTDPENQRYEVPQSVLPYPTIVNGKREKKSSTASFKFGKGKGGKTSSSNEDDSLQYSVTISPVNSIFTLTVTRLVDNVVLFNLADLEYSPQFLQLSNMFPQQQQQSTSGPFLYGLGEHVMNFQLPTDDHSFTMWDHDSPTPYDQNVYGSHPFYLQILPDTGSAHGLFMRSSNGMDVIAAQDRVTFRIIGGILEWYIFLGTTPESVTQQYHSVIGLPALPPYWSLGWHQCKYGWTSLAEVQQVVDTYAAQQIPLDTIWTDINYMDQYKDFTWDPVNFPQEEVATWVNALAANGQHYVVIVDPGISNTTGYPAYDEGLEMNCFIKTGDGVTPYIGKVWPGTTAFPDFLHSNSTAYWTSQIQTFLQGVNISGLWIDMNEISNFIDGIAWNPDAPVNNPPYSINNMNKHAALSHRTLPMDAIHGDTGEYVEYDVHNLFGVTESIATKLALEAVQQQRAFVLSRSTFPGSGVHTAHWTGDNRVSWDDLYRSIPGILNFNMYGVPLTGADICGFIGTPNEQICARWTALGAFYPFSRNHHIPKGNQEPYRWPSVEAVAKRVLAMRYSLLPTLYTLFNAVHLNGGTIFRSLMFNYPQDTNTYGIDHQFFWSDMIQFTPVINENATSVEGYFSLQTRWYDLWTLEEFVPQAGGAGEVGVYQTFSCDIACGIIAHITGGSILVTQSPELTTAATRLNPFELIVALDQNQQSEGDFFWDSGADLIDGANSLTASFVADASSSQSSSTLNYTISQNTFSGSPNPLPFLSQVTFTGWSSSAAEVNAIYINNVALQPTQWNLNSTTGILVVSQLQVDLNQEFTMTLSGSQQGKEHDEVKMI